MNTNQVTLTFTVNVPESLRRGIVAPAAVTLTLEEIAAASTPADNLPDLLYHCTRDSQWHLRYPHPNGRGYGHAIHTIPTPDAAGLMEVIRAEAAAIAPKIAALAAEAAALAVARTAAISTEADALRADPSSWVRKSDGYITGAYIDRIGFIYLHEMPADIQTAVEAAAEEQKARCAAAKEAAAAAAAAAAVARETRLRTYLDTEQTAMLQRGLLHLPSALDKIEARLSREAAAALAGEIAPPQTEAEVITWTPSLATSATRSQWRTLRAVERRIGQTCSLMEDGRILATTTTADGREIRVALTLATA